MTFNVTPTQFPALVKELTDSGQVAMTPAPIAINGDQSGTIEHENIVAQYSYSANGLLTVNVVQGGNFFVTRAIRMKLQNAIDALKG